MGLSPTPRSARRRSLALHAAVGLGAAATAVAERKLHRRSPALAKLVAPTVAAGWYALLHAMERRAPFREEWNRDQGDVLPDAAFALTGIGLATVMDSTMPKLRDPEDARGIGRLPTAVGVVLGILAYDAGHYWIHRVGHEWGPGWKLHSVHHSAPRLYWFNALRFHLGEATVDQLWDNVILRAIGINRNQHAAMFAFRAMYGQLQHCNIEVESGPLNRVFSTPDLHRWHHSTDYDEGDTNYGAVTSVYDQLLGSYFEPGRPFDNTIGVGRMPHFPTGYRELQRVPLDWERIKDRNAATWYAEEDTTVEAGEPAPIPV